MPRKCALIVLGKLEITCFDAYAEHEIYTWLNHPDLAELSQYPLLNLTQLEFFRRCPFMLSSHWSFQHNKIAEFAGLNGLIQILNDCYKMAKQLTECLAQLKKLKQVQRFHQSHDDLIVSGDYYVYRVLKSQRACREAWMDARASEIASDYSRCVQLT